MASRLCRWQKSSSRGFDQCERRDFQDLCAEPESGAKSVDGGLEHFLRAVSHARSKRLLPRRAKARLTTQETLRFTVQDGFVTTHCLTQPASRHFHCEKAMSLPRVPVRPQTALVRRVVSHSLRIDYCGLRGAFVNGTTALEIDANFEALRMKTAGTNRAFSGTRNRAIQRSRHRSKSFQKVDAIPPRLQPKPVPHRNHSLSARRSQY